MSIPFNLFAQKEDSIYTQQLKELQAQTNKNNEIITDLKYQINSNKDLSDVASKIISWTSTVLAILAFGLAYWGYTANKNIKEIESYKEKLSKEIKDLEVFRTKTENNLQTERENLSNLKTTFETDKENLLSAIIPIIEGHWFYYQGENEKAIESYTMANQIMPNSTVVFCELNKLLLDKGNVGDVIKSIENIIGVNEKDNRKIKQLLINAYRKNKQYDMAENLITQLGQYKEDGLLCYELGTIKLFRGNFIDAHELLISAYRIYLRDESSYKHSVLINLALCQMLMNKQEFSNNLSSAKSILEIQKAKTPKQPYIMGCLGMVFFAEKNYSESITYFKTSFELKLPIMNAKSFLERIQLIESFCDVENETCKKILGLLHVSRLTFWLVITNSIDALLRVVYIVLI